MPYNGLNDVLEGYPDHLLALDVVHEFPFQELLFLVIGQDFLLIELFSFNYNFISLLIYLSGIELWLDHISKLFVSSHHNASGLARVPFYTINDFVVKFVFSHDSSCLNIPND